MKKIFLFIIFTLYVFTLPTFANDKVKTTLKNNNAIDDELLNHEKFKNLKQYSSQEHKLIKDELLEQNLEENNGIFNLYIYKNETLETKITDELLNSSNFNENAIETEVSKQSKMMIFF